MNSKDLLIINIGRFFAFITWLRFSKDEGFQVEQKFYTRYPKNIESDDLVDKILSKIGFKDGEIICLVDEKRMMSSLSYPGLLKMSKYWKKNFQYLYKELELDSAAFISIDYERIRIISGEDYSERVDLSLDAVLKGPKFKKILDDLNLSYEIILNYINRGLPLPQNISDYFKSFILSYAYGKAVGRGLNLSKVKFLIIESELFKSGFLDKSGLIHAISIVNKNIDYYSFDSIGIWQVLLNDTIDQYNELKYLNSKVFYPEFTVEFNLQEKKKGTITLLDINNEAKDINFIGDIQGFISSEDVSESEDLSKLVYGNLLNINTSYRLSDLNRKNFKSWYKYYQIEDREYFDLSYIDNRTHKVVVNNQDFDNFSKRSDVRRYYYDVFNILGDESDYNVMKIPGEVVEEGEVLIIRKKLSGIVIDKLRSQHSGIVEKVDKDNGWICIKSFEKIEEDKFELDYEHLKNLGVKESLIEINAIKIDSVLAYGEKRLGRIMKFNPSEPNKSSQKIVWVENNNDLEILIENLLKIQPSGIVLDSISRQNLSRIVGHRRRNMRMMSVLVLNGFGNMPYNSHDRRVLEINSGNEVLIETSESSIYFLLKKGKFQLSQNTYPIETYANIFTFDDWNLKGDMIYNDQDSVIFRDTSGRVIDVANFNLIKFNEK